MLHLQISRRVKEDLLIIWYGERGIEPLILHRRAGRARSVKMYWKMFSVIDFLLRFCSVNILRTFIILFLRSSSAPANVKRKKKDKNVLQDSRWTGWLSCHAEVSKTNEWTNASDELIFGMTIIIGFTKYLNNKKQTLNNEKKNKRESTDCRRTDYVADEVTCFSIRHCKYSLFSLINSSSNLINVDV